MDNLNIAHPVAIDHIPSFITAPGQTDTLFNIMIVFLLLVVFLTGVLYLRLHALPEQMAHKGNKVQLQLVAVLGLIALLTHNQIFWIAALLLAMTDLPNFISPITSMASSLEALARKRTKQVTQPDQPQPASLTEEETANASTKPILPLIMPSTDITTETNVAPTTSAKNEQEQN